MSKSQSYKRRKRQLKASEEPASPAKPREGIFDRLKRERDAKQTRKHAKAIFRQLLAIKRNQKGRTEAHEQTEDPES